MGGEDEEEEGIPTVKTESDIARLFGCSNL